MLVCGDFPVDLQLSAVSGQRDQLPARADRPHQRRDADLAGRLLQVRRGGRGRGGGGREGELHPQHRVGTASRSRPDRQLAGQLGPPRSTHSSTGNPRPRYFSNARLPCDIGVNLQVGVQLGGFVGSGRTHTSTSRHCIKTDARLTASFPGQPRSAGTRKVKSFSILMKQELMGWHWHQMDHMQIICTYCRHITLPAPHHSIFTGRMLFLLPYQQRQSTESKQSSSNGVIFSFRTAHYLCVELHQFLEVYICTLTTVVNLFVPCVLLAISQNVTPVGKGGTPPFQGCETQDGFQIKCDVIQ